MPDRLEYAEEEDLFGSEGEYDPTDPSTLENVNPSVPIATPTAFLPLASTSKSAERPAREQVYPHIIRPSVSGRNDGEVRLQELRDSKKKGKEEPPKIGVRSLKSITMSGMFAVRMVGNKLKRNFFKLYKQTLAEFGILETLSIPL